MLDKPDLHHGRLEIDSPGLFRSLRRAYDQKSLKYLCSCYSEASKWGGLREWPVKRELGVSFNPKPARIAQILLKETDSVSVFTVSVAILSTVPEEYIPNILEIFSKQKLLLPITLTDTKDNAELDNIALASSIDWARHLHLSALSAEDKLTEFKRIESNYLLRKETTSPNSGCNRMMDILGQWLNTAKDLFN